MMKSKHILCITILILVLFASCEKVQKVTDIITQPTEREIYERSFEENDSLYNKWVHQFENSKSDSLQINLPFVEQGVFSSNRLETFSFNFEVQEGERLIVHVENLPDTSKVFINLLSQTSISNQTDSEIFEGIVNGPYNVILDNGTNDIYKLIVQPELNLDSNFILKIYTEPIYAFPVAGKTNKSIKSFWGASRDGGKRLHKGVDIFAAKGTPVIAITDGLIRRTGDYGLGGKQVWLWDNQINASLYYAHLDSIITKSGVRVKIGDTLGLVGNTGNARTTAPHLHFGIYKRYRGAVDPLPFIKESELLIFKEEVVSLEGELRSAPANIRIGPSTKFEEVLRAEEKLRVDVLGKTDDWYHIILPLGEKGFIHESLLRTTESIPVL